MQTAVKSVNVDY